MTSPIRPGEVLAGKYAVEKVLGQGGMGVVVAGRHVQLGNRVAIKFLLPDAAHHPEATARFLREARAAVQIQSEHVARVSDVGTLENGAPYMVMEFLQGSDLGQALAARNAPFGDAEAVDYLLQGCEAIAEAHALGIVHRDLKPANLFLTRRADGSTLVKVLDFGISKIATGHGADANMTATAAVMGSPAYMSPEQVRSAKNVDARTDIWALGMILYEFLGQRPAFEADTMPGLLAQIVADPPIPLRSRRPDISPRLEAVVMRCLEKDVSRRVANVAELAEALLPFSPASQVSVDRIRRLLPNTNPNPAPGDDPSRAATSTSAVSAHASHRTVTVGSWGSTEPGGSTKHRRWLWAAVAAGIAGGLGAAHFALRAPSPTTTTAAPVDSRPAIATEPQAPTAGIAMPLAPPPPAVIPPIESAMIAPQSGPLPVLAPASRGAAAHPRPGKAPSPAAPSSAGSRPTKDLFDDIN